MDRTGVFIDAGYLFAGGSILLCGEKRRRGDIDLSNEVFLDFVRRKAESLTGLPLLRIYWYDGTDGPPTSKQIALAHQPDVKLRLGLVNRQGEQKGVDSLIVTDLINLSRNRAMACAVLLTGDEDIRVGVQQAQDYGVRVHLLGMASPSGEGNQAALLKQEADTVSDISQADFTSFMACRPLMQDPQPAPGQVANSGPEDFAAPSGGLGDIVKMLLSEITDETIQRVATAGRYSIPSDIDGKLLRKATQVLGRPINEDKKLLRDLFFAACQNKVGA